MFRLDKKYELLKISKMIENINESAFKSLGHSAYFTSELNEFHSLVPR